MRLVVTDVGGHAKTTEVDALGPGERRMIRVSLASRPARVRIVPIYKGVADERGAQSFSPGAQGAQVPL